MSADVQLVGKPVPSSLELHQRAGSLLVSWLRPSCPVAAAVATTALAWWHGTSRAAAIECFSNGVFYHDSGD